MHNMNDFVYSAHKIKNTYTALSKAGSTEKKAWLGERISSLQRRTEIPGVMERNGAKNINSVNNNMIVQSCSTNDLRLYRPSCNILAYKQYYWILMMFACIFVYMLLDRSAWRCWMLYIGCRRSVCLYFIIAVERVYICLSNNIPSDK